MRERKQIHGVLAQPNRRICKRGVSYHCAPYPSLAISGAWPSLCSSKTPKSLSLPQGERLGARSPPQTLAFELDVTLWAGNGRSFAWSERSTPAESCHLLRMIKSRNTISYLLIAICVWSFDSHPFVPCCTIDPVWSRLPEPALTANHTVSKLLKIILLSSWMSAVHQNQNGRPSERTEGDAPSSTSIAVC